MPTSGDLKSRDSLFCTTPPSPNVNNPNTPTHHPQIDPATMASDIIWGLTWSTCYQNACKKSTRNRTMIKKVHILRGNRLNFKLKHRKAQKSILCGRFGHLYGRAGGKCRIRESWHICSLSVELGFSIPFVGADSGFLGLNSGFQSSGFLDSTRKTLLNSEFQEKNFPTIEIQVMLHVHRASSS